MAAPEIKYLTWRPWMRDYLMLVVSGFDIEDNDAVEEELRARGTLKEKEAFDGRTVSWRKKQYPDFAYAIQQTIDNPDWYWEHVGYALAKAEAYRHDTNVVRKRPTDRQVSSKYVENTMKARGEFEPKLEQTENELLKTLLGKLTQRIAVEQQQALAQQPTIQVIEHDPIEQEHA
jgi:hypothetical protein